MNAYDIGNAVKLSTASSPFSAVGGAAFDPSTVTLFIVDPTRAKQTIAMGSLSHDGVGIWSYVIANASISGTWFYEFEGGGNCQVTTGQQAFYVRPSKLIPG